MSSLANMTNMSPLTNISKMSSLADICSYHFSTPHVTHGTSPKYWGETRAPVRRRRFPIVHCRHFALPPACTNTTIMPPWMVHRRPRSRARLGCEWTRPRHSRVCHLTTESERLGVSERFFYSIGIEHQVVSAATAPPNIDPAKNT